MRRIAFGAIVVLVQLVGARMLFGPTEADFKRAEVAVEAVGCSSLPSSAVTTGGLLEYRSFVTAKCGRCSYVLAVAYDGTVSVFPADRVITSRSDLDPETDKPTGCF